jgi:hemoglobin/transferrin/lactoferrin receptor protein
MLNTPYARLLLAPSFSGLLLLAAPVIAIAAQNQAVELPAVAVTASRSAVSIEDSPRTITVIGPQQVREYLNAGGIQRLFDEVPGIEYARSGGLGGQLVMRGQNSRSGRTVLAIDGDRHRGRSTLEFNLLDPNAIERIEIIRGPASALYGSDAMSGVVNIITRRANVEKGQDFSLAPRLRAAEWSSNGDMYGLRGELVGGGNGFDVLVGVNQRTANDYDSPLGKVDNSDYDSRGLDFNIGYRTSDTARWELSGRYQNVTSGRAGGLGAAPGPDLLEVREDPLVERYLRLNYNSQAFSDWADSLDASLYVRHITTDSYQVNRKNATRDVATHQKNHSPTVFGGHLTATRQIEDHQLSFGGDFFNEAADGRKRLQQRYNKDGTLQAEGTWNTLERDTEQTSFGLFVSDDWYLNERWSLAGALRGDMVQIKVGSGITGENSAVTRAYQGNTNNRHSALSGSLGAVYRLTPDWHLVGNLSRGFRAPSGQQMARTSVSATITTLPAPDLEPETNLTAELGVRWYGKQSHASLTAYQSRYDDLIALAPVSSDIRQQQNISKATIEGIELDGETQLTGPWSMRYSLAATRGTNNSEDKPLAGIAPLSGQLTLRYQADRWYSEGKVRGYRGRTRIDDSQERETASYAMVDLYAGSDLSQLFGAQWKHWKVSVGVENLFDRVGRNPTTAEDLAYSNDLLGNPLVEPGRTAQLKLLVDY